ncbi:MAG TPA: GWxTD domain-containing protein [Thermoanaerobaculia bacterium]|nr:GWxTD domain-containing protein [Thermoanaerobaculia bacterium]
MKRAILAAAAFCFASVALCQLSKYKEWAKSPEAYFLTAAEKQEWSKIQSDADAEKFIADYWAKRGGERFKEAIARRIAAADQQFKMRRQKGSESARGRIFIVLGNPSKAVEAQVGGESGTNPSAAAGPGASSFDTSPGATAVVQTWTYAKDKFDSSWDIGEIQVRINVDPQRGTDELVSGGQVNKAIEKVAEHTIVSAGGKAAPGVAAVKPVAPAAATGAAAAVAPAAATPLAAAARGILEALLREPPAKSTPGFWGGDFRTVTGEPFYAFQIVLPAAKVSAGGGIKLAGIVTKADGQEVSAFWEDAALIDLKRGPATDKACDRSVVLPPGSYRGAFGLFGAEGGAALVSAAANFSIPEKSSEFRVSPMILSATLTPLTKAPQPTDAFVFGMEKPVRVEPKGNGVFTREDGLWYFYTVSNPAVPAEAPAAAASSPAAGPTPAAGAPTPTAGPAPKPRVMTRLGVLRDGKPAFQPATLPAELQNLGPDYYASGSEIPLATFEPGYYTFTLNVRDLNAPRDSVAFKGVDRSGDFVVLMPDGAMPPVPTPAAAKPTPTPRPKPKRP